MNITKNGEYYKELVSTSANPNLLGEEIHNLYVDPKLKFWCSDKLAKTVYDMNPLAANVDSIQHQG